MTSDSKEGKYGVPNPFVILTVKEIPTEMKVEVKYLRTCDMVIDDVDTIKNELVEDETPPAFKDQTLDETDANITGGEPAITQ